MQLCSQGKWGRGAVPSLLGVFPVSSLGGGLEEYFIFEWVVVASRLRSTGSEAPAIL